MEPKDLRYTRNHEWVRVQGKEGTVGITDYAQSQLGDVVFVEVPDVGRELKKGEPFGVVESVKSVADLYAPVSGRVVRVNQALGDQPELVNQDAYGDGWMVVVALSDEAEVESLLDAEGYTRHVASEQHA